MSGVRRGYEWMRGNPVSLALMVAVAAVAISLNAERRNDDQDVKVTNVTRKVESACTRAYESDGLDEKSGRECSELGAEIAKGEPLRTPCTSYQRVTSRRGLNCPRFYVPRGAEGSAPNSSKSVQGSVETTGLRKRPADEGRP